MNMKSFKHNVTPSASPTIIRSVPLPKCQRPDVNGRYGKFGGRYVPETLIVALDELTAVYAEAKDDPAYQAELDAVLKDYVGRETPLYHASGCLRAMRGRAARARKFTSSART